MSTLSSPRVGPLGRLARADVPQPWPDRPRLARRAGRGRRPRHHLRRRVHRRLLRARLRLERGPAAARGALPDPGGRHRRRRRPCRRRSPGRRRPGRRRGPACRARPRSPHVATVSDPYADPAGLSPDGTTLVAHLRLDVENPVDMPIADSEQMLELAADVVHGRPPGRPRRAEHPAGRAGRDRLRGPRSGRRHDHPAADVRLRGGRRPADPGGRRRSRREQHAHHVRHLLHRRTGLVDVAGHDDGHRHRDRLRAADGDPVPRVAGRRPGRRGRHGRHPRHGRTLSHGRRHHGGDQHAGPVRDGPVLHARRGRRHHPRRPGGDGRQHHPLPRSPGLPRAAHRPPAPPSRPPPHGRGRRRRPRRPVARLAGLEQARRPAPHRRRRPRRRHPAGARRSVPRRPLRLPRRRQQPRGDQHPSGLRPAGRRLRSRHERPAGPGRRAARR